MLVPNYEPPDKIGKLTDDEMADFLAQPWNARLATVTPENTPYIIPLWFEFDATERVFYIVARERARYVEHILHNAAVALHVADDLHLEHTRVLVEGTAEIISGPVSPEEDQALHELVSAMARKYLGEEGLRYAQRTMRNPRYLIRIVPQRWTTWTGQQWAARYRYNTRT
jgi:nitroimidazol reductase NimA-like FMN-containing flavoprotein (pyridoxamine 5'-phosphate oxidase superfamily)